MSKLRILFPISLLAAYLYLLSGNIPGLPALGSFFHPKTGFWQSAKLAQNEPVNTTEYFFFKDSVIVIWDSLRIPHIQAKNEDDLYATQGFIAARDRMWQMELQTHFAAGRVSEIVGKRAIDLDRKNRRIGLAWAAKNAHDKLKESSPEVYASLLAYATGVNKYIKETPKANLPIEYKLLNYTPETWTPLKSCLLIKYMANDLCGYDDDDIFTQYQQELGDSLFAELFPDQFPEDTVAIIPFPNCSDQNPLVQAQREQINTQIVESQVKQVSTSKFYNRFSKIDPDNGSNNWALAPSKTDGKSTLLSNDPHLGLNLPSLWYTVQLQTPNLNCYGVSLPGLPFIVIGHNEQIAWGLTNAGRDVRDWYQIQNINAKTYQGPNGEMPFRNQVEVFNTKEGDVIIDTVKYTHLGPVVYDQHFNTEPTRLNQAMYWTAHQSETELIAFYDIIRAKNYTQFTQAASMFNAPGQNFLFIDRKGNIGLNQQGQFMDRTDGSGKFIQEMKSYSPYSFIPKSRNPEAFNPEIGFLSSANQHPLRTESEYAAHGNFEHYRNRRIHSVLNEAENWDVQNMIQLQNDNYTLLAEEILPTILSFIEQSEFKEILTKWNYESNADSKAATLFHQFWKKFKALCWDELSAISDQYIYPEEIITSRFIQNHPNHAFFDIVSTPQVESLPDLVKITWDSTINQYASFSEVPKYGNYKQTIITHLSKSLTPFSREVFVGGGRLIVNATKVDHGPSWRMVVKMNPSAIETYGIYPGGQSGNPASKYYDNFLPYWESGKLLPQQFILNQSK